MYADALSITDCCLRMNALLRKCLRLRKTIIFLSVNISIPIKHALTYSTKQIIQKCCSYKAVFGKPLVGGLVPGREEFVIGLQRARILLQV